MFSLPLWLNPEPIPRPITNMGAGLKVCLTALDEGQRGSVAVVMATLWSACQLSVEVIQGT